MTALLQTAEWIIYLAATLLALIALVVLYRSMFADRSRGRRRCPKCWYDLGGISSLVCPECGKVARREAHTRRTRRRWLRASVGFITLLASACLAVWPTVRERGWASFLPNYVLVRLMPRAPNEPTWNPLIGNATTSPIEAEFASRAAAGRISSADWLAAFKTAQVFKYRKRWPKDTPFTVAISAPPSWCDSTIISFAPRMRCLTFARVNVPPDCQSWNYSYAGHQQLGMLPPGTSSVTFDVYMNDALTWTDSDIHIVDPAPQTAPIGACTFPVTLVDSIDDAIPSVSKGRPPAKAFVSAMLSPQPVAPDSVGVLVRFDEHESVPRRAGIGTRIQLILNGKVRSEEVLAWSRPPDSSGNQQPTPASWASGVTFLLPRGHNDYTTDWSKWTIRVVPDAAALLEQWDVDANYEVSAEATLSDALKAAAGG